MNRILEIKLGNVLISLLEAEPGHEKELHRWYERDHFFSGCMIGASFFSGRRYVATRKLKAMRFPTHSAITEDISKGSFLTMYWMLDGQYDQTLEWSIKQVNQLHNQKRMGPAKLNVSSGFYHYEWGRFRDDDGVPAELALEHPFKGVSISYLDSREGISQETFKAECGKALDVAQAGSACSMSLCLQTLPLPDSVPSYVPRTTERTLRKRHLILHFFQDDPAECWSEFMETFSSTFEKSNCANIVLAAPFIPTIPGTDAYIDQL